MVVVLYIMILVPEAQVYKAHMSEYILLYNVEWNYQSMR